MGPKVGKFVSAQLETGSAHSRLAAVTPLRARPEWHVPHRDSYGVEWWQRQIEIEQLFWGFSGFATD